MSVERKILCWKSVRQLVESTSTYKLLKITQSDKLFSPFYFLIFRLLRFLHNPNRNIWPGTRHKAYNVWKGGLNERYREKFIKNNVCARPKLSRPHFDERTRCRSRENEMKANEKKKRKEKKNKSRTISVV